MDYNTYLVTRMSAAGDLERPTKDLAARCLAKFDDSTASVDVRTFALEVMVSQVNNGNTTMLGYLPEICQRIEDQEDQQSTALPGLQCLHRQIIDAVLTLISLPEKNIADVQFGPVVRYLVKLVACEDVETASEACEFWSLGPLALASTREPWMTAFEPQLPRLIEALIDRMIFRQHVDLSSLVARQRTTNFLTSQRATKALEVVSKIYPPDLTSAAFMPLVEKRVKSDY